MCVAGNTPAITLPCGLSYPTNRPNGRNEVSCGWRDEFRSGLATLVDRAAVFGAKQADVSEATIEEIEHLRIENEPDPDPADDVSGDSVEETANAWSGGQHLIIPVYSCCRSIVTALIVNREPHVPESRSRRWLKQLVLSLGGPRS